MSKEYTQEQISVAINRIKWAFTTNNLHLVMREELEKAFQEGRQISKNEMADNLQKFLRSKGSNLSTTAIACAFIRGQYD